MFGAPMYVWFFLLAILAAVAARFFAGLLGR